MAVYVFDATRGRLVDKSTGEPMIGADDRGRPLQAPRVWSDLPGYRSPIDGKWVEGRRARRYDLESNNCVDANDLPRKTDGTLKNAKFAEKLGLTRLLQQQ